MTRASSIYQNLVPVEYERHKSWSFGQSPNLEFSRNFHSCPITVSEFFSTAKYYPIAFSSAKDGTLTPVAILGVRRNHNLFLDKNGMWLPNMYIPSLIRVYPFNLSKEDGGTIQLLIDEAYPHLNQEGQGEPFFDKAKDINPLLKSALNFLEGNEEHLELTRTFTRSLMELNILEPIPTKFKMPSGEAGAINDYLTVNKQAFDAIAEEKLGVLAKAGILEPIYLHLSSLTDLDKLILKAKSTRT